MFLSIVFISINIKANIIFDNIEDYGNIIFRESSGSGSSQTEDIVYYKENGELDDQMEHFNNILKKWYAVESYENLKTLVEGIPSTYNDSYLIAPGTISN